MTTVAISSDFLTAYAQVPRAQQRKVREFVTRFQMDPTAASINYEPIHRVRDARVRTVRIDLAYRAVVLHPEQGDVYLLAWVDHHDEAMAWARNKVFEVNPVTGALQVIDAVAVERLAAPETPAREERPAEDYGPFETFSDADLLRTGLPQPLLPAVRALPSAEALDAMQPYLPEEAFEALYWIAHLGYSVDQALAEVQRPPTEAAIDLHDLDQALAHPDSQRRFVVVERADELMEILNAPLERWRVFLHPSQARLVQRHFNGPARVLGGAGTGKTVVAMHRARHLAREVFTASTDRVLFTTFTRNLARNIRANLETLCGPEIERIEVVHLHSWAASFLAAQKIRLEIAGEDELSRCWQNALAAAGDGAWTPSFIREEWQEVVQAQGISEQAEYLRALRAGRHTQLSRPQRAALWAIFAEYRRNLAALGKVEWTDLIRETRLYLANQRTALPYRAIVVDETQDMHPEELRLLRQMVPAGPNDLFLVGDAHQRIYGRPVVLSRFGIEVRGRASKLRINYRTTEEIRNWSVAVLTGQAVDDLDGGLDTHADYRSLMHGLAPTVRQFATLEEEQDFLAGEINALREIVPLETVCLVARTHRQLLDDYIPALQRAGIPYLYLHADTPEYAGSGVRLATMHRVKGLEFWHVLIAGVNEGVVPLLAGQDEDGSAEAVLRERCLLHVASSRARETVVITSHGVPSHLIAALPELGASHVHR